MLDKVLLAAGAAAICLGSATASAWSPRSDWKLPQDVLETGNQISFNQGARGVWYFMEAASLTHDPATYRLLPSFNNPCLGTGTSGEQCWYEPNGPALSPKVELNVRNKPDGEYPARTLSFAPANGQFAVIAWHSPVTGTVAVSGAITNLNTCTIGVGWSVDQGTQSLASGVLGAGASATINLPSVSVKRGEALYVVLDARGDQSCDESSLTLDITRQ